MNKENLNRLYSRYLAITNREYYQFLPKKTSNCLSCLFSRKQTKATPSQKAPEIHPVMQSLKKYLDSIKFDLREQFYFSDFQRWREQNAEPPLTPEFFEKNYTIAQVLKPWYEPLPLKSIVELYEFEVLKNLSNKSQTNYLDPLITAAQSVQEDHELVGKLKKIQLNKSWVGYHFPLINDEKLEFAQGGFFNLTKNDMLQLSDMYVRLRPDNLSILISKMENAKKHLSSLIGNIRNDLRARMTRGFPFVTYNIDRDEVEPAFHKEAADAICAQSEALVSVVEFFHAQVDQMMESLKLVVGRTKPRVPDEHEPQANSLVF